jgi:hypothetical protein
MKTYTLKDHFGSFTQITLQEYMFSWMRIVKNMTFDHAFFEKIK